MGPSDRSRPATKADAKPYMAKAREFEASIELLASAENWDAVGLAAIHAGISAADAVLAYRGGVRSAGRDHRAAVDLLRELLGGAAADPSKHLKRLIDKKNLVEYEQRRLTRTEALDLAEHAHRFLRWAASQFPASGGT